MKVASILLGEDLCEAAAAARTAEALGYDVLTAAEGAHDPFLPLAAAAMGTSRVALRTSGVTAFARSPMVTAVAAWDLQRASRGRFGLGLRVPDKASAQQFSVPVEAAGPRLREYLAALRATWRAFQDQQPLAFESEHYQLGPVPLAIYPAPLEHPHIPVHIRARDAGMARLAGELAEGLELPAFVTMAYARDVLWPRFEQGLATGDRPRSAVEVSGGGFLATGKDWSEVERATEDVRRQVASFALNRRSQGVFQFHGWTDTVARLDALRREGRWDEVPREITDDMVHAFAVVAPYEGVVEACRERYAGLVDCLGLVAPAQTADERECLRALIQQLKEL